MEKFVLRIKKLALKDPKRIVLPEPEDDRVLKAAAIIAKEKIAKPILLGDIREIEKRAKSLKISLKGIEVLNPAESRDGGRYAEEFFQLRKDRGIDLKKSKEILKEPIYFGTMMVHLGDAEGLVSGAIHPTAHTLRPALQIIKTREAFHKVSGVFFMVFKKRLMLFADAAVEIEPDAKDLADIALDTARTAKRFGIAPKVAMLSFSTKGSAKHPLADKVIEATKIAQYRAPDLLIDGELQLDAAVEQWVSKLKSPDSKIKGEANILIFPDLQSANIGYKLTQFFGHAKALGPILQGLKKPVNDLSRGCSVEEIVNITAITCVEAQGLENYDSKISKLD